MQTLKVTKAHGEQTKANEGRHSSGSIISEHICTCMERIGIISGHSIHDAAGGLPGAEQLPEFF
jgi:hypothetical protein